MIKTLTIVDPHARLKTRNMSCVARTAYFVLNTARCYLSLQAGKLAALFQYETTLDKKNRVPAKPRFLSSCHLWNQKLALPPTVNHARHITHASREFYPRGHSGLSLYCGAMQPGFAAAQLRHVSRMQKRAVAAHHKRVTHSLGQV